MRIEVVKAVSRNKSANGRVIEACLEIVKTKLLDIVISTVEEGVKNAKLICQLRVDTPRDIPP